MADVRVTDPLKRVIRFTSGNWTGHVTKRHPEVGSFRRLAEQAVRRPLEIRFSPSDSECRLYFGKGPRPGVMIVVVANVLRGLVKTAHFVKVARGDLEWSRRKPSKD